MIVTLIKKERIYTLHLPLAVKGQFWLLDKNRREQTRKVLSIEGVGGKWYIRSHKSIQVADISGKEARLAEMKPSSFYRVSFGVSEEPALLFCEEITPGRLNFKKYMLEASDGIGITIGRNPDNAIAYNNRLVSGVHCTLMYHKGRWTIQDYKSGNGTFVNNYAVTSSPVNPGDSIYILGLTIIVGSNFIAVNDPDNNVVLNSKMFKLYRPQVIDHSHYSDASDQDDYETEYFYRSPRFKRELEMAVFEIDTPPSPQDEDDTPLILAMGPSITMGMMAVTTGSFAVINAITTGNMMMAIPAMVMALSMLLGTILWPTITRRFQKNKALKNEVLRQTKYREYLMKAEYLIHAEYAKQETILKESFAPIGECIRRVTTKDISLWERSASQSDFLRLRVGVGDADLLAEIRVPERGFTLHEDILMNEAMSVGTNLKKIRSVPVSTSFYDNYFASVIGDRKKCIEFANGLIIQLTAYYGYDDVKTVFIYDETEESEFKYAKWLPHAWTADKKLRMIATNINELKEVSAHLEKEIEARKGRNESSVEQTASYYVIFAFSLDLALRAEILNQLYAHEQNLNISIISFFDELKHVPKECTEIIELIGHTGKIYDKTDASGKSISFINDISYSGNMDQYSFNLANIFLDTSSSSYQLPKMVTFMDMYGVSKVDHLNATLRWKENDPTASIQAPVGINTFGDLFYLDLHEKFHGPHGLVAGTTGSGKSEFIITYILSLALNYHPHEVAFILIDYKGGGMAKAFEKLPHTAGIITNLDGSAIKRSLVSINSELKYRQAIFNDASKLLGTRVADIYAYQKEYRSGRVKEPIPHLFIISDEFAELKSQQPEFMTELVSTARIGRSLGVHLILATQKPDGVVDDQIWSNSKFKISLKVQDRSDSMSMIKRPDAADLVDTGRFYLLVGNNEVFELGQSAWAGANYAPTDTIVTKDTCIIDVIDINGRVIQSVKPDVTAIKTSDKKQLDAITEYITQTAAEEKISTRQLWLPPIEPTIFLYDLHKAYPQSKASPFALYPLIGEVDDPARQRRFPLNVPITESGNTVIYGSAGGGKATFLTTMIYDLLCTHSAENLNIYLLDFGAETLRAFKNAPQVGDVVFSNESEKIVNLLKMLKKEVANRKKLFADWGGDHSSYCERSGAVVPNILVALNNYTNFREMYYDYEDKIISITQESAKYGIYFIFTATATNGITYRITQNCGKFFALQLNDELDYSGVVGRTGGLYPAKFKGRGLVNHMDEVYEYQVAHISDQVSINDDIRSLCDTLAKMPQTAKAKRIPVLPDIVNPGFFAGTEITLAHFPIGVNKASLNIEHLSFASSYITLVSGTDIDKTIPFLQGIAEMLAENTSASTMVLDADSLFIIDQNKKYEYLTQGFEDAVVDMYDIILERYRAHKNENKTDFENKIFIIPSTPQLCKHLTESTFSKLNALLERGSAALGTNIIIGDAVSDVSAYVSQTWYRNHCGGNGIWVGDGAASQYNFTISKSSAELRNEISDSYGVVINSGKYKIAKLLQSSLSVYEDEGDDNE